MCDPRSTTAPAVQAPARRVRTARWLWIEATGLAARLPARWAPAPARLLSGLLIAVALGALFAPSSVWAATRTWTGNGGDDLWTTGGNWGGTAPTANDDLLFPDGALRMTTNLNNFPGETKFNLIQFTGTAGGYVLGASNASAIYPVTTIVNTNGDNQINFNLRIPTVPTGGLTITTNGSGVLNVNAGITGV